MYMNVDTHTYTEESKNAKTFTSEKGDYCYEGINR